MTFGDTQLMLSRPGAGVGRVFAWIAVVLVLPWPLGTLVAGRAAAQTPPPISLWEVVADLKFGIIVSGESLVGEATIDAETGTKTVSGGVFDFGGADSRAEFLFCGQPGFQFDITIFPPSASEIVRVGGGGSLGISNLTSSPALSGTFGRDCRATVVVGGTLDVPPMQLSGTYSGQFDVTVEYTPTP